MSIQCFDCGSVLLLSETKTISRQDTCDHCYKDIRCCKMCTFYDPKSYNECREPTADRITEKEKANFCDFYKLGQVSIVKNKKNDLLAAANALFKK